MKSKLDVALDALHTIASAITGATRRRSLFQRARLINFLQVGSFIFTALAVTFPRMRSAAALVSELQQQAPAALMPANETETTLLFKLNSINAQCANATGDARLRLEAQRDILLQMLEERELNRCR